MSVTSWFDDQARTLVAGLTGPAGQAETRLVVGPAGSGRSRVLHAAAGHLRAAGITVGTRWANPGPEGCALLVDDLDRLDGDALQQVTELADRHTHVIVATCAPRRRPAALRATAARLTLDAPPLRLGSLTADRIAELLPESDRALADRVHRATGGIPCLVHATLPVPPQSHPSTADLNEAADREIRVRLGELPAAQVSSIVLATLDASIGTADIAAALGVGFDEAADIVDLAACTGLLDADAALRSRVHRLAVTTLGRSEVTRIERALESALRAGGGLSAALSDRLAADGLTRSVDAELDALTHRMRCGEPAGVEAVLDGLWERLDDGQRVRAVDLSVAAAAAAGDSERALGPIDWVRRRTPAEAIGPATRSRWATLAAVTGKVQSVNEFREATVESGPQLADRVDVMVAGGVCASLSASGSTAMTTLMRAAAAERDCLGVRPTVDTAANLAALLALHVGRPDAARSVLSRVPGDAVHGHALRGEILLGWAAMASGDLDRAEAVVDRHCGEILCARDDIAVSSLRVAIARRRGDGGTMRAALDRAMVVLAEYRVDLLGLMFVGELWVAAAAAGRAAEPVSAVSRACELVDALGPAAQWSSLFHWYGVHAAIASRTPAALVPHAQALAVAGRSCDYAAALARAGKVWVQVLGGDVDADDVEAAARELDAHAHTWDAAQLAAQAALCAQDPRVAGTMLQLARSLRTHHIPEDEAEPDEPAGRARMTSMLSEREREVAALLLDGITYRDIGARLFISPKTVEHHVARIKRRLGADSRTELLTTLRAMKLGSAARGISRPA